MTASILDDRMQSFRAHEIKPFRNGRRRIARRVAR